ncbi:MAG TPA: 50S ribosomal protein L31 [Planctomycetota bacterium]|nr:50S ribosomal protein L31 [Planctomycetota bacterium]
MKKDIHPDYKECTVTCGCGNTFKTGSTRDKIAIEVCSNCHPFYTGKQKFVDTAGMVDRFTRKWTGEAAQKAKAATAKPEVKKAAAIAARLQAARQQQTIAAVLGAPKPGAAPASPAGAKPAAPAPAKPAPAAPAAPPAKNS